MFVKKRNKLWINYDIRIMVYFVRKVKIEIIINSKGTIVTNYFDLLTGIRVQTIVDYNSLPKYGKHLISLIAGFSNSLIYYD